jgi:hypothetical protein
MSYRRIQKYTHSVRVSAAKARQDRTHIIVGDWILGPTHDMALATFFAALAPAQIHESTLGITTRPLAVSEPWFARREHYDPTCATLDIRQGGRGRGLRPGRPLVTGQLKTRRMGRISEYGPVARIVSLDLNLNPTRFLHHQPKREFVERMQQPVAEWVLPEPRLIAGTATLEAADERSLDGKDNVLLGLVPVSDAHGLPWSLHLRRYWYALLEKFDGLFHEAAGLAMLAIRFADSFNLRSVETYWEFHINDPSSWLLEIEPIIRRLGLTNAARNFQHPDGLSTDELTANRRSITLRLRSGVLLRVYAKTSHRVRFEVEHDLVETARLFGGRHTSTDPNVFFDWLEMAALDAASHVNRVLEHLERQQTREGAQMSVTQLVIRVTQVVGDPDLAERLLSLVAANQSISSDAGLAPSIRRLVSHSILETAERGRNRYVLTPEYRDAGRGLRYPQFPVAGSENLP